MVVLLDLLKKGHSNAGDKVRQGRRRCAAARHAALPPLPAPNPAPRSAAQAPARSRLPRPRLLIPFHHAAATPPPPPGPLQLSKGIRAMRVKELSMAGRATRCFHIVKLDGSEEDFSYLKCIKGVWEGGAAGSHSPRRLGRRLPACRRCCSGRRVAGRGWGRAPAG
jgi:hypothetical protein